MNRPGMNTQFLSCLLAAPPIVRTPREIASLAMEMVDIVALKDGAQIPRGLI